MASYFDLHFHPVFKQFITKFETDYPTKRLVDDLFKEMDLKNDLLDIVDEVILHILESQSCIEQLHKGGVRLGVANIASMELGIADSEGFIANILRSRATRPMDQLYMRAIRRGEISYYRLFLKELDLYRKVHDHQKGLTFLSRKQPAVLDEKKAYMVLGMEGGHNLSRKKIGTDSADNESGLPGSDALSRDFVEHPTVDAASSLQHLQQALWEENFDLFCVTLTHLTFIAEQHLATHAFGLKLLNHDAFYPVGNGLTEEGKKVIDVAYTMKVNEPNRSLHTPIFIDLKHMSLKSRQDFYEYRKNQNYRLPLLATHMGVTGYSIEGWKDALKSSALLQRENVKAIEVMTERRKAGEWGFINKNFTFNPWTINLMDEDITEIIESSGLIGLSLDIRILGFQALIGMSSKDQSEYLSPEDFKHFFPGVRVEGLALESLEAAEVLESWLKPTKEERHPLCLCFNILHIISVGKLTTGKNPWKHLCIGSDFDGLIDPVKICKDSSKMTQLEQDLVRWLPIAEQAYREQNGGPKLLTRNGDGQIALEQLKEDVRGIMYENGKWFVERWLKNNWLEDAAEILVMQPKVAQPDPVPRPKAVVVKKTNKKKRTS